MLTFILQRLLEKASETTVLNLTEAHDHIMQRTILLDAETMTEKEPLIIKINIKDQLVVLGTSLLEMKTIAGIEGVVAMKTAENEVNKHGVKSEEAKRL